MSRIKIALYNKPVPYQIQKCRNITQEMTGNPSFHNPDPTLPVVESAIDELEKAYTASLNKDKAQKALMRTKQKVLLALIIKLGDYVQSISQGDENIILSSGFEVRKTPAPVAVPQAPVKVLVKAATIDGQLEVSCKSVNTAKSYVFEWCLDPINFKELKGGGIATKPRYKALNLEPGTKYWFRVMAINAAGNSGWSEPSSGRSL